MNHKKMINQAMQSLGVPEGTSMWIWPHKPLGKPTGKPGAKSGPKMKGGKPWRGMKQRKSGGNAGTIFAGWD